MPSPRILERDCPLKALLGDADFFVALGDTKYGFLNARRTLSVAYNGRREDYDGRRRFAEFAFAVLTLSGAEMKESWVKALTPYLEQ